MREGWLAFHGCSKESTRQPSRTPIRNVRSPSTFTSDLSSLNSILRHKDLLAPLMANLNLTTCPAPFLNQADYPPKHGFLAGRFCGPFNNELSCCLPCPLEHWTYSDSFERKIDIAYWLNVPALVCQVLLLLSFVVLPSDRTHRHYLSVGLCVSLILLEVSRECA